jgi:hypothetical protein
MHKVLCVVHKGWRGIAADGPMLDMARRKAVASAIAATSRKRRRPMSLPGLDRWYRFIKSHDRAELKAMLHPDVASKAPSCTRRARRRHHLQISR